LEINQGYTTLHSQPIIKMNISYIPFHFYRTTRQPI